MQSPSDCANMIGPTITWPLSASLQAYPLLQTLPVLQDPIDESVTNDKQRKGAYFKLLLSPSLAQLLQSSSASPISKFTIF